MEENKNPLQGIVDFYEESVAKQDKKGFAETYKKATANFLKVLDNYLKIDGLSLTAYDIDFGDGYFIFGHGTNSTVSFHVEEAPGWLFGIWWSALEKEESTKENPVYRDDAIYCEFFAQYEEEIDKFKPSASMFEESFNWILDDKNEQFDAKYKSMKVVRLILEQPYLAWYREMHYTDFNEEYISPEKAKKDFDEHHIYLKKCEDVDKTNKKAMLDIVYYLFGQFFESGDCFIKYDSWCSPSYHIIMRNIWKDDKGQEDSEDGNFGLWDWCEYEDEEKDKALWDKTEKECKDRANELHHYWWNPVANWLVIRSGDDYRELKQEYMDKIDYSYEDYKNESKMIQK